MRRCRLIPGDRKVKALTYVLPLNAQNSITAGQSRPIYCASSSRDQFWSTVITGGTCEAARLATMKRLPSAVMS